jgi:hypothetical protein
MMQSDQLRSQTKHFITFAAFFLCNFMFFNNDIVTRTNQEEISQYAQYLLDVEWKKQVLCLQKKLVYRTEDVIVRAVKVKLFSN